MPLSLRSSSRGSLAYGKSARRTCQAAERLFAVSVAADTSCARSGARHNQAVRVEVDDLVGFAVDDVLELLSLTIAERIARDALVAFALVPSPHVRLGLAQRLIVVHIAILDDQRPLELVCRRPTRQISPVDHVLGCAVGFCRAYLTRSSFRRFAWLRDDIQPKSTVEIGASVSHEVRHRSSRSDGGAFDESPVRRTRRESE